MHSSLEIASNATLKQSSVALVCRGARRNQCAGNVDVLQKEIRTGQTCFRRWPFKSSRIMTSVTGAARIKQQKVRTRFSGLVLLEEHLLFLNRIRTQQPDRSISCIHKHFLFGGSCASILSRFPGFFVGESFVYSLYPRALLSSLGSSCAPILSRFIGSSCAPILSRFIGFLSPHANMYMYVHII